MMNKELINKIDAPSYSIDMLIVYLNNVLKMGRLVQGMLYKFKDAYFEKNQKLSEEIIQQDDRVDYLECKLEHDGTALIATTGFSGKYLKATLLGLKMGYIFESMGDLWERNAELNIELLKFPPKINISSFEDIFIQSQEIFAIALRIFSDFITTEIKELTQSEINKLFFEPAQTICILSEEIKALNEAYKKYLYKSIEPIKVINLHLEILENIQKFSDNTTNICENILLAISGNRYKCRKNNLQLFYTPEDV